MMRLLNFVLVGGLVAGAGYVYGVKYEATRHAEESARLRLEIARERDAIADLKAQWAQLNRPDRIQALAERHLQLRPLTLDQLSRLEGLPDKVVADPDPIGTMLEALDGDPNAGISTGTLRSAPLPPRRGAGGRP